MKSRRNLIRNIVIAIIIFAVAGTGFWSTLR